jgi:hypothetical protein
MPSALLIAAFLLAAEPVDAEPVDTEPALNSQSAARLKLMKETAARIEIRVVRTGAKLELEGQPVLRWDNARSFTADAATFIWQADHRPSVIGGMWIKNRNAWFQLHSLSPQLLTATLDETTRWSTSQAGISWEPVTDVPRPATSQAERLRQMKQLAASFSVHAVKTAPDYDDGSIWHLRMLAQPIHRYAAEANVDGAIFAFAQGTDPEAYLILESDEVKGRGQWHFGFAPACVWELHAKRGEHEVWSREKCNLQEPVKAYGLVGPFDVDQSLLPTAQKSAK